jgi:hypothetical protein
MGKQQVELGNLANSGPFHFLALKCQSWISVMNAAGSFSVFCSWGLSRQPPGVLFLHDHIRCSVRKTTPETKRQINLLICMNRG